MVDTAKLIKLVCTIKMQNSCILTTPVLYAPLPFNKTRFFAFIFYVCFLSNSFPRHGKAGSNLNDQALSIHSRHTYDRDLGGHL